jgi:REP element-mobilizing transposase RayT
MFKNRLHLFSSLFSLHKNLIMSYVRVWVHYVWAVKHRQPILTDAYRDPMHQHILENAKSKNIYLDRINGYYDHIHCLISLGKEQTIESVAHLLKGESSNWFNNKSGLNAPRLNWQAEYYAASVSELLIDTTRAYIDAQIFHHKTKTFAEEYEEMIREFGFPKISRMLG